MKSQKITVTVVAEALAVEAIPALLLDVADQLQRERESGSHNMSDGDKVVWDISKEDVEF